jgi:hypothetical protein
MGRPINKKYFANKNPQGVGGEGVASVAVTNSGTNYTNTTTITFAAPGVAGGAKATGTLSVSGGHVTGVTITGGGSGYLTNTGLISLGNTNGGTGAAFTVTLTTGRQNGIAFTSYITTGTTATTGGDIIKQESARRYQVRNSQGVGRCKLVTTSSLTPGTMNIIATDVNGSTYYVSKLTARRAVLIQKTSAGAGFAFASNQAAGWTMNAASTGRVSISNI